MNTWLLAAILVIVGYMQIDSAFIRSKKQEKIDAFVAAGQRFTKEDGDRLQHRVEMLEHRIEILEDVERKEHARK